MKLTVTIAWQRNPGAGSIEIAHGRLMEMTAAQGAGRIDASAFAFTEGPARLNVTCDDVNLGHGAFPTMATVRGAQPFTFLMRDISAAHPIWIPEFGVAVSVETDERDPTVIGQEIAARGGRTALQEITAEPDESFEAAAAATREVRGPTWLGLSRDMRLFQLSHGHDSPTVDINPRHHGASLPIPGVEKGGALGYSLMFGKGMGCVHRYTRRLEDGCLPVLHGCKEDGDVVYHTTAFVTLETSPLTADTLRGTHYLVADGHGRGHMFTEEQARQYEELKASEAQTAAREQVVLYYRVRAVNRGVAPRYAWFGIKSPPAKHIFDGQHGFGSFSPDQVFAVMRLNGRPLPKQEVAVLVAPGEAATAEFMIPHAPLPQARAQKLAAQSFDTRHAECHAFWRSKLERAARLRLPEKRIDEMVRAGLLHLDLVAYGLEPDAPVAATIGVYCPIGSESSPIIQFMDSMGWHDLARRSLEYFLEKQHDDGFIQNFGGYMLETGPALWSMGEHFRYTRDEAWVRKIKPKLLLAVDFLLKWRDRNRTEERRACGAYGLMEGKVADPEDPFGCFMLNGYAYVGIKRVAEMLADIDPDASQRIGREAEAFKQDLRAAIEENLARSPVVPLGDGTWTPTMGPWAEARGPVSLLTDDQKWSTHGAYPARDSLIGPIYLLISEVIAPDEPAAGWLLNYHADLMHMRNVGLSQPYYSPHPWAHLARGEVKPFLKEYYNAMAGLADRDTYSFWEHFFFASPHKTHEEGWFLMRTRWMLYRETGSTLNLLSGIPRAWLANGKRIECERVASYFGPLSFTVASESDAGIIRATITCEGERRPGTVAIRLPHPDGMQAARVEGGVLDAGSETVSITPFGGRAEVTLYF